MSYETLRTFTVFYFKHKPEELRCIDGNYMNDDGDCGEVWLGTVDYLCKHDDVAGLPISMAYKYWAKQALALFLEKQKMAEAEDFIYKKLRTFSVFVLNSDPRNLRCIEGKRNFENSSIPITFLGTVEMMCDNAAKELAGMPCSLITKHFEEKAIKLFLEKQKAA